jgi:hypothetical protein
MLLGSCAFLAVLQLLGLLPCCKHLLPFAGDAHEAALLTAQLAQREMCMKLGMVTLGSSFLHNIPCLLKWLHTSRPRCRSVCLLASSGATCTPDLLNRPPLRLHSSPPSSATALFAQTSLPRGA